MDSRVESLKPRGVLEVVDAAADFLRRRPRDVVIVTTVIVVPSVVISLLIGLSSPDDLGKSVDTFGSVITSEEPIDYPVLFLALAVQSLLFSFVAFATTRLIVADTLGHHVPPGRALLDGLKRAPTLILLWIFVHVAEVLGLLALGIGSIIAMCGLMVTVPALAAEQSHTAVSAFRRSWRLTDGVRGRVFAVLLVLALITTVLNAVLVLAPASLFDLFAGGTTLWALNVALQAIANIVVQGVVAGATAYTYIDLRVRREALDIELQLQAVP